MTPIEPFAGYFTKDTLLAACAQATRDVRELTDHQLAVIAVYDLDGARMLERKRARAWEDAERAEALARATLAPVAVTPVSTGLTAETVDALVDGIAVGVKEVLAPLRKQLADLETVNRQLEQRILELEAQRVIAGVER